MKRILLFSLVQLAFINSALGQNISGIIISKDTGIPISDANIVHAKSETGTISNLEGVFRIATKTSIHPKDTLIISHIGYFKKVLSVAEFKSDNHIVQLESDDKLDGVTVASNMKKMGRIVPIEKLASLEKGMKSTGSLVHDNKIILVGGDGSYSEDALKKTYFKNPRLGDPSASLSDITFFMEPDLSWSRYYGNLLVYDINENIWETVDSRFRERAYHNIHVYKDTLFVLGGKRLNNGTSREYLDNTIELMDFNSSKITVDQTNPHQASNFASVIYEDNLLVMGGSTKVSSNGWITYSDQIHLYDLKTGLWYELGTMTKAKETQAVKVNDNLYLIGGFSFKPLKEIECYNLKTGRWQKEAELFQASKRPGVVVSNETIYIVDSGRLLTYDTKDKILKEYILNLYKRSPELQYHKNALYIIGGYRENEYSKTPDPGVYRLNLDDLRTTAINRSKTFKPEQLGK